MTGPTAALRRRLAGYWRMEAANVVLVPAFVLFLALPTTGLGTGLLLIALLPVVLILIVGTLYWRSSLQRLEGDAHALDALLAYLDSAQRPLIALTGAGVAAAVGAVASQGWTGAAVATLACATLAVLEYINYFEFQLQNFDNAADFRRFRKRRGFRRAHLGLDLAAFRKRRVQLGVP